jgi:Ca-activated chloride channel homolog
MIHFLYPWVLFFLVFPAGFFFWVWFRRSVPSIGRLAVPFDHAPARSAKTWWFLITLSESIPALLLAIAVIMLAGPLTYAQPRDQRKLSNIEFCVDISGSMMAPFGQGNRYDAAMEAITSFIDYRKGDSYGLTFFGSNYLHWVPLTNDANAIKCAPPFMKPDKAPFWIGGGTEIAKALEGCKKVLMNRPEGERMIILVTDGFSSDLPGQAEDLARQLKNANIVVFAIVIDVAEIQDEIVDVTRKTGGDAFVAGDPDALKAVFARVDALQPVKIEKRIAESIDYFEPFTLAGMILLSLAGFTSLGLRYTPW